MVITRNVDLSVGSTLGISAFAAGTYLQGGGNPVVAIALAVLLGIGFGLLNGLLVSLGQVPALVVTLGTLYIIRGIDSIWVGSRRSPRPTCPDGFVDFGSGGISAVPYLALIALAVLVATAYYLKHFGSGRELYASAPTRRPPGSPASPSASGSSPRTPSAAPSPGSPARCTWPGSATSTPAPATATN